MKILLFADGSTALGAGHQVRTGVLGRALQARGHVVTLAHRDLPGSSHAWAWHGLASEACPADLDADTAIRDAFDRQAPDVIVVDHYSASRELLARLGSAAPLVAIDDVPAGRFPRGTLVVNPAPAVSPRDYPDQVVALGPAHALIREEFSRAPGQAPSRAGILVMPGSGAADWLQPALESLLAGVSEPITVIAGASQASMPEEIRRLAARHPARLTWRSGLAAPELAETMRSTAAGVLSASTVVFEASAAGLPFVAMRTAENQARVASGLRERGVDVLDAAHAAEVADHVAAVMRAQASGMDVDGRGAARVAARIEELRIATSGMTLRPAVWSDGPLILEWANEAGSRRGSFTERPIEAAEHEAWLARKLAHPDSRLWIAEEDGRVAGTLRLERSGPDAVVSITIAPASRGGGSGGRALRALEQWTRGSRFAERLVALIREDNAVSQALFTRAGYTLAGTAQPNGVPARRFVRRVAGS